MSKTNQAFIKAYRQDLAEPSGRPRPGLSDDRASDVAAVRRATSSESMPTASATQTHVSQSSGTTKERRPLSAYMASDAPRAQVAQPRTGNFFRPGTSIASFHWPAVCRELAQTSGEQFDRLAERVNSEVTSGRSVVGVLSLFPKCGATTVALCLARRIAQRVQRLILVDANFTHPAMSAALEVVPTAGWEEALRHAAQLSDAAIRAVDDRVDLLALGSKKVSDALPLAGGLQAAVSAGILRHAYDLILMDLGAYFDPDSQGVLLELVRNFGVDSVLAVAGPEPADPRDLHSLSEHLGHSGCQLLGTVENRINRVPQTINA